MHSARLGVLMLSPSSYQGATGSAIALHVWRGTARHLTSFMLLSLLVSLVLIRIVLTAARNYGLSQFALETLVRVLVLELLPMFGALFVALQIMLPAGAELRRIRARDAADMSRGSGAELLSRDVLPRAVAGLFTLPMFTLLACLAALFLCYSMLYGPMPSAFGGYSRAVGKIFEPVVAMIFVLKAVAFSLAVSLIPMLSAALEPFPAEQSGAQAALQDLVRVTLLILLVEVLSLLGNYY